MLACRLRWSSASTELKFGRDSTIASRRDCASASSACALVGEDQSFIFWFDSACCEVTGRAYFGTRTG